MSLDEAVRAAVIDWNTLGARKVGADVSAHITEAVLAHLRAVAADEGVRELVGRAVAKADGFDRVPPGYDLLADAALAAFLGALAGDEASPRVSTPEAEVQALTEAHRSGGHIQQMTDPYGKDFK